jgi:hypothetical protein
MKKTVLLLVALVLNSCQFFQQQLPSEATLLNKELKNINFKTVDELPSFADCEKIDNKPQRTECFFGMMTQLIQEKISNDSIPLIQAKVDTVTVAVTILANATMEFSTTFPKNQRAFDSLRIDSIYKSRLIDFPKVNPAIKRGMPVKTKFVILVTPRLANSQIIENRK